eukprot:TRINITY_DN9157_c0_g1_i1.p1 TRINITY_DN9157_c0_g1~~TRINITY_DN9157_c0_g1_i1.p1  ORF type:complete len:231 (+),score=42.83 TRINITY_DN9157_c0_g1_i1:78-770(+)
MRGLQLPPPHRHYFNTMTSRELLFSGAEARVFAVDFFGKPAVVKERPTKGYRHPTLDKQLRGRRTAAEAKALARCRKLGIRVPAVYNCDMETMTIIMERIAGRPLREVIANPNTTSEVKSKLAEQSGVALAKLHSADMVHGDLTTSNIFVSENGEIYLIDFGLSSQSTFPEDHAVDLYVFERAVLSTHPGEDEFTEVAIKSYKKAAKKGAQTMERLEKVRARGRKRSMVG